MRPIACEKCGASCHAPYEDGLIECIHRLEEQRDDAIAYRDALRAENARLRGALGKALAYLASLNSSKGGMCEWCEARVATRFQCDTAPDGDGLDVAWACDACKPDWEEVDAAATIRAIEDAARAALDEGR